MKIKYETISINPPPLDIQILVVKTGVYGETGAVVTYSSLVYSEQEMMDRLADEGFTKWAEL